MHRRARSYLTIGGWLELPKTAVKKERSQGTQKGRCYSCSASSSVPRDWETKDWV